MNEIDVQALIQELLPEVGRWGLRALGALTILVLGWTLAKIVRGAVRRALVRSSVDGTLVPFLSSLVYYAFLVFVLLAVLGLFGVQTTSVIAVVGATSLAIGLALQGTMSNFASGVMLMIFRPFRVGDYVEAGGAAGSVAEVGIFATRLNSPDNIRIIVPNTAIYSAIIKNYSGNDTRRVDLVVGVSYGDDIAKALATVRAVLDDDPRVLSDPQPVVAVGELADSSVNLVVRPWCATTEYWGLRFDLTRRLKDRLEAAGCTIPFPQSDVHLHKTG